MPAQSKAQQRFMGMVHATQKGDMENPSKDVETVAKSISKKDAKDFASTPHKGLPDNIKEMILSELRSIGVIQKEYFSVVDDIKKTLSAYKDNKGTDKEKQIVSKLKLLNDKKKKLSDEMDGKVSSMYKDAELKVDEASTTASADGYATPYAFSKPGQTKNKNNKLARVSGGTVVDDLEENKRLTNKLKLLKELNAGDKLTHKHNSKIEIELVEPTNRGWKVYQIEKGKRKLAYFDKQDITGPNAIFTSSSMNENLNESVGISSMSDVKLGQWVTLKNGTRGKIIAISDKSNPKYKKGIIVITPEFGKGNAEISIYTDLKKESVNEDQSWKRLLDPYNWFKSKDIFQNRFKNVPSSIVQELIKLTKKNGDDVEVVGKNVWGFSDKSGKDNQALWQYSDGHLYYTNPKHKSTYDTIIPKLVNSKNESVNENRWIDIKNEDSPATTKVNKGISNINKQLAEIEKFLGWYGKLKSENGLGNEDLWKRTNSHIYSIKERLLNLERKLRKISE